jgi:hypothetical protein
MGVAIIEPEPALITSSEETAVHVRGQLMAPIGWIGRMSQFQSRRTGKLICERCRRNGEFSIKDQRNGVRFKVIGGDGRTGARWPRAVLPVSRVCVRTEVETLGNRVPFAGGPANPGEEMDILEGIGHPLPRVDDAMRGRDDDVGRNECSGAQPLRPVGSDIDLANRNPGPFGSREGTTVIGPDDSRTQDIGD